MNTVRKQTTPEEPCGQSLQTEPRAVTGAKTPPRKSVEEAQTGFACTEIVSLLVAGLVLLVLARPVLLSWIGQYSRQESYYAHAPLIPAMIALMLWHRRGALNAVPKQPSFGAIWALIPALALFEFAAHNHAMSLQSLAFLFALWSSVWLVLGTRFWKATAFPLLFVALMVPLPGPVLNDATVPIQHQSTLLANALLHLMGFATNLAGNLITMDNFALAVDTPCSGLHTLLALVTIGAGLLYLMDGPWHRRLWLLIAALPLSLLTNSLRVALIGVCGECIGPQAAHVFHDWSGMMAMALGAVALLLLAKGLGCRKFAGWPIF